MKIQLTKKQQLITVLATTIICGTGIGFFGSRYLGQKLMITFGTGLFVVGASLQLGQVILKKSSQ